MWVESGFQTEKEKIRIGLFTPILLLIHLRLNYQPGEKIKYKGLMSPFVLKLMQYETPLGDRDRDFVHCGAWFLRTSSGFHFVSCFRRVSFSYESKMPLVFLEQLPLPSLQSYVTVSILLFVSSAIYSINAMRSSDALQSSLDIYDIMSQASFCFWVSGILISPWCSLILACNEFFLFSSCTSASPFRLTWTWRIAVCFCLGKLSRELSSETYARRRCKYVLTTHHAT